MTAQIEFVSGIAETTVPDIRVTRSRNGGGGTATFYFEDASILKSDSVNEISGMYLVDDEGEIMTRDVKGKFVNGQAKAIEGLLIMQSEPEWERFLRFMERYAQEQGLELTRAPESDS